MAANERTGSGAMSRASRAMAAYGGGDDDAFVVVYEALGPLLLRYLLRLVRDPALAEDLLQVTFLHLHMARGRFIPGADVGPWARTIARRLVIDHVRHRRNERRTREPLDELADVVPSGEPSGEASAIAGELSAALSQRVETLPPRQHEAFRLMRSEGLRADQAAARLGTTTAAVKLRFHRALDSLREVARAQ